MLFVSPAREKQSSELSDALFTIGKESMRMQNILPGDSIFIAAMGQWFTVLSRPFKNVDGVWRLTGEQPGGRVTRLLVSEDNCNTNVQERYAKTTTVKRQPKHGAFTWVERDVHNGHA